MKNLTAHLLSDHMSDLPEETKKRIIKRFSNEVIAEFETLVTALHIGVEIHAATTSKVTGHTYVLNLKIERPDPLEDEEIRAEIKNKA